MGQDFTKPIRILNRFLGLTMIAIFSSSLMAADCSDADITLNSQSAVDSFQATYGTCDTVTGNLVIGPGADISNLDGLSALTSVGEANYRQ